MALIMHEKIPGIGEIGQWDISESEDYFINALDLRPRELDQVAQLTEKKRIEWLAARLLLHQMSGRINRGTVLKDNFGKPYLENSDWNISMSHSKNRAAVIASPYPVGIDIQVLVPKITAIAKRFLNEQELKSIDQEQQIAHLHLYWGAKEALYKAYGKRELDFCKHILLSPILFREFSGTLKGRVKKGAYDRQFNIHYQLKGEFMLVWAYGNSTEVPTYRG